MNKKGGRAMNKLLSTMALTMLFLMPACSEPQECAQETVPYSVVKQRIVAGEISEVKIEAESITATLAGTCDTMLATRLPEDDELIPFLEKNDVIYEFETSISVWLAIFLLGILAWGTTKSIDIIANFVQPFVEGRIAKKRRTDSIKRRSAIHEAGHAIVAYALEKMPNLEVTIVPHGNHGGNVQYKDMSLMHSKDKLLNRIAIKFGGRAAEKLLLGDIHSGCIGDLISATEEAERIVTALGMSERFPNIAICALSTSGKTRVAVEQEVTKILDLQQERALAVVEHNRELIEELAKALMQHETLKGKQLQQFLDRATSPEDSKA